MTSRERHQIEKAGKTLRRVIQDNLIDFEGSDKFPVGCCGAASDLFKKRLELSGFKGLVYVWGWKGEQSHGWLEYKDHILDITADQFPEIDEEVLIIRKSEADFHQKFKRV